MLDHAAKQLLEKFSEQSGIEVNIEVDSESIKITDKTTRGRMVNFRASESWGRERTQILLNCGEGIDDETGDDEPVWVMRASLLDESLQGKRYGALIYTAIWKHISSLGARFVPESCLDNGSTSDSAKRVWKSIGLDHYFT